MSSSRPEIKLDIPTDDAFTTITDAELPAGLNATPYTRTYHRDVYFDTPDHALAKRGVSCRVRIREDDTRILSLKIEPVGGGQADFVQATVKELSPQDALAGVSDPARKLQAYTDPGRLVPSLEIETARMTRYGTAGLLKLRRFAFMYDHVTVRQQDAIETFRELKIRHLRGSQPTLDELTRLFQDKFALRTTLATKLVRGERRLKAMESELLAREVQGSRQLTVIGLEDGRIALLHDGNTMSLPAEDGAGEDAARAFMNDFLGVVDGQLRLLGTAAAASTRPLLEVWLADRLPNGISMEMSADLQWMLLDEVIARAGSPVLRDPSTLAALAIAAKSNIMPERPTGEFINEEAAAVPMRRSMMTTRETRALIALQLPELPEEALDVSQQSPDQFVNEQLSWLEFNARVLALAEDPGTPLLARLLFLSIFSKNLDEFFMVQIGLRKAAVREGVEEVSVDGLTPQEELDAISVRLAPLIAKQQRLFRKVCLPDLERRGIRLRRWRELEKEQRDKLREYFDNEIFPLLTPHAMTQAPGHKFPHLENLSLSLAVMVRNVGGGPVHFAHLKIARGMPRFLSVPDVEDTTDLIPIEDVIGHNVHRLYPGREVEAAAAFRITRSTDIQVDESRTSNLLHAIEEGVKKRPFGSVVRIEVDGKMPQVMRDLLQRELSFEDSDTVSTLSATDFIEAEDIVDLGALTEIAFLDRPELSYPPFEGGSPLDPDRPMFDQIREGDKLVHHPYDTFTSTVQRFIEEAAEDEDVIAIKLTLYRSGSQSGIIEALTRAAAAGKDVSVFVELKARFDEEMNIQWAKKLERAGIHVVTGLVKLKTHAKTSLIVRREEEGIRRYVHIGTGNYNASTARLYTDLGLFSCEEELGLDLHDLFNEFTGASEAPRTKFRQLLVAPRRMLKRFVKMIEREAEHAQAGRGGRIRVKLNGLADEEIIAALYRASQAGVEIDIVVRGICSLRPGVPGLSERIRVFSILGRFLEHSRIYHFGNGGDDEYYIGSADWRPRNLRRRVEVVTPVRDPACTKVLDEILELDLEDPTSWQMQSDGGYARQPAAIGLDLKSAQEEHMERANAR